MQINRLFEIVYILLDKKTITAKELANRFEVSQRTIYRDIDVLSGAGIPIYMSKGKGGGISLLENYVLDKSLLSDSEQNDIIAALQSLNATQYPDLENVVSKLGVLFKKEELNWIDIDFTRWGANNKESFNVIKSAILNRNLLTFNYFSSYGQKTEREVEPIQLWYKEKTWYLKAYCLTKMDIRTFKLSRIKDLQLINKHFERRAESKSQENSNQKELASKVVTLKLSFLPEVAYRVYDEFNEEEITRMENGNFEVVVTYPETDWIYGYILSFTNNVKVLEPIHVKQELKKRLEEMIKFCE